MLAIVIPTYEPDLNFVSYVKELISVGFKKILIVNDGSNESYDEIFGRLCLFQEVILLKHAVNLGKGRALKDAFNYLLVNSPDIEGVITVDSDGQHSIKDVIALAKSFQNDNELILGCRNFDLENIPQKSKFGNKLTRFIFKFLYGSDLSDTQTGLRVLSAELMRMSLNIPGERFEFETNMLIACREKNIKFTEKEIETLYDSKDNHVTHFNPITDSIKIYKIFCLQIIKYLFSAFSSWGIDILLFTLFIFLFKNDSSLNYIFYATFLARFFSSLYNCCINYYIVFKSNENKVVALVKYYALVIVNMLISSFFIYYVYSILRINETVIKIIIDSLLFIANYFIQRVFIFRHVSLENNVKQ